MHNSKLWVVFLLFIISCQNQDIDQTGGDNATLYFPSTENNLWETISFEELKWNSNKLQPLLDFIEEKNSKSFIILKNGKIAVEWYAHDFAKNDLWYWASAGKVLTSTTVGIAQQEGFLNIDDKTSDYLGIGWTNTTTNQENKITILNQLTMTSGLNSLIFDCTEPECLNYVADVSTRWAYHNAPYTLLEQVVSKATNESFDSYYNDKLRNKIGMNGFWKSTNGFNNVYFSDSRSMARFGLLMLNKGAWVDEQIINIDYFEQMVNTSQNMNKSYGYLWWLNGKQSYMLPQDQSVFNGFLVANAPADMFAGMGKNDQRVYVIPSKDLVIIRMGEVANDVNLASNSFDNELWEKINDLYQ